LPLIQINDINRDNIFYIYDILVSCRLMNIERYYLFSEGINGYSLSQARNNSSELDIAVDKLLNNLSNYPLLHDMKVIEQGIAINNSQSILSGRIYSRYLLDETIRQVRVQLRGTFTINNDLLTPGDVYIIDNVTDNVFSASAENMQLVFNYLYITN